MSELRGLIERAIYDLEHGWPDAAYDAIGRAWRLLGEQDELQATIGGIVAAALTEHETRLQELEAARAHREDLRGVTKYRGNECRRLRNAIKAIVAVPEYAAAPPNAAKVRRILMLGHYHPLPCERTVRLHLAAIRGPRVGTRGKRKKAIAEFPPLPDKVNP
jgi:hypothetical protein